MTTKRIILAMAVLCVGAWVLASYRAQRAVAPPLDPYGRGEWYYLASEFEEAVKHYKEALVNGLDEATEKDARFKVARCYHEAGQYREAIAAYEEFRRRYPQSEEGNRAEGHMEWIRQNHGIGL